MVEISRLENVDVIALCVIHVNSSSFQVGSYVKVCQGGSCHFAVVRETKMNLSLIVNLFCSVLFHE